MFLESNILPKNIFFILKMRERLDVANKEHRENLNIMECRFIKAKVMYLKAFSKISLHSHI